MSHKKIEENNEFSEDTLSSNEIETYKPVAFDNNLEVDERAYLLLEHINLEWPAQSIAIRDSKVYLGTNPNKADFQPELLEIDLKNADFKKLKFREKKVHPFINRIRIGKEMIFAVSDNFLTIFDNDLKVVRETKGTFSYGLCITDDNVFVGTLDGSLNVYNNTLALVDSYKIHESSIEDIVVRNGIIYTGSTDHTLKLTSSSGELLHTIQNNSDINCLDVNSNNDIVFGDDKSKIHIVKTSDFAEEVIEWHISPISVVKWKDNEIFVSGSDEQVCLWDTSLEEEWEYHKYLLFVHQGQQFYKDVIFDKDRVITTAQDGLCIFVPVSFADPEGL